MITMLASGVRASDSQPDQAQDLKRLSLEELMELDVTSVSRRPERIVDAPAAVSVITAEDIRRSGASTLPDALRLVDGMTVARVNGASWAISTRGFTATANSAANNNGVLFRYDATSQQYIYNLSTAGWSAPATYQIVMTLDDGTRQSVMFSLR